MIILMLAGMITYLENCRSCSNLVFHVHYIQSQSLSSGTGRDSSTSMHWNKICSCQAMPDNKVHDPDPVPCPIEYYVAGNDVLMCAWGEQIALWLKNRLLRLIPRYLESLWASDDNITDGQTVAELQMREQINYWLAKKPTFTFRVTIFAQHVDDKTW